MRLSSLNSNDPAVVEAADGLYERLEAAGLEVLYDDREEPPGVKFNDADLIGLPLRVVVSRRSLAEGQVELKVRTADEASMHPLDGAVEAVKAALEAAG